MKVTIKERDYDFVSDYPNGWQHSSGGFFKYPVLIAQHKCFVKRFELKRPLNVSGWDLLMRLKYNNESNLPRIYDIISIEEHGKQVHYVFYGYLKGATLNAMVKGDTPIEMERLTNDLFSAIGSINKYDHWFADFYEKNIFCEDTGRFLLLDLDSAQPSSRRPDDAMNGSKDYWTPVFKYYKDILKIGEFNISDIPGITLNYLQIIFLILHIKIFLQDP